MSPSFVLPEPGTVGIAFNALSVPIPIDQGAGTAPTESSAPERAATVAFRNLPVCGVVTVQNHVSWSSKSVCAVPPSVMKRMGMHAASIFAIAFNQSEYARYKPRWALVTNRGSVLVLTGVPSAGSPLNPADFSPCVDESSQTAGEEQPANENARAA